MRKYCMMMLSLLAAVIGTAHLSAQTVMPSVETIVQKMDAAIDPQQKMKTIKCFSITYEGEFPAQSIKISIESIFKSPDKLRRIIKAEGMPDTIEVCNGNSAWTEVSGIGVTQATGAQLNFKLLVLKMTNPANRLTDIFPKIELAPNTENVAGKDCYKLSCYCDPALELPPMHFYVDSKTFFVIKLVMVVDSDMGQIPSETILSDYRLFDGLYFPVTQSATSLGMTMTTKITDIKFNLDVKESIFIRAAQ
jgi:outer membrane lipoprotein-sorting protein